MLLVLWTVLFCFISAATYSYFGLVYALEMSSPKIFQTVLHEHYIGLGFGNHSVSNVVLISSVCEFSIYPFFVLFLYPVIFFLAACCNCSLFGVFTSSTISTNGEKKLENIDLIFTGVVPLTCVGLLLEGLSITRFILWILYAKDNLIVVSIVCFSVMVLQLLLTGGLFVDMILISNGVVQEDQWRKYEEFCSPFDDFEFMRCEYGVVDEHIENEISGDVLCSCRAVNVILCSFNFCFCLNHCPKVTLAAMRGLWKKILPKPEEADQEEPEGVTLPGECGEEGGEELENSNIVDITYVPDSFAEKILWGITSKKIRQNRESLRIIY